LDILNPSLTHVAHYIIGDDTCRGISGGQRKRVSIGMELAASKGYINLNVRYTNKRNSSTSRTISG
jgi:ABC-type enterochelin transport system ATPase subunit